jgi:hypothetical protein
MFSDGSASKSERAFVADVLTERGNTWGRRVVAERINQFVARVRLEAFQKFSMRRVKMLQRLTISALMNSSNSVRTWHASIRRLRTKHSPKASTNYKDAESKEPTIKNGGQGRATTDTRRK